LTCYIWMDDLISAASRNHRRETIIHLYYTELEQVEYLNTGVWDVIVWLVTLTRLQNFRVLPTVVKWNYGIMLHGSIWNHHLMEYITLCLDSTNEIEQWYIRHNYFIVLYHRLHVSTYIQVIFDQHKPLMFLCILPLLTWGDPNMYNILWTYL